MTRRSESSDRRLERFLASLQSLGRMLDLWLSQVKSKQAAQDGTGLAALLAPDLTQTFLSLNQSLNVSRVALGSSLTLHS